MTVTGMLVAARPFRFAGAALAPGDPVVGEHGEVPTGRTFGVLVRRGWVHLPAAPPSVGGRAYRAKTRRAEQQEEAVA